MPSLSHLSLFPVHWNSNTVARSTHLSAYLRAFPHKHHLLHQAVGTIQSSGPPPSTPPTGKQSSDYYHHKLVLPVLELFPFLCLGFVTQHDTSEIQLWCCECPQLIYSHCVVFTQWSLSFHMKAIDNFLFRSTIYLLTIWQVKTLTFMMQNN